MSLRVTNSLLPFCLPFPWQFIVLLLNGACIIDSFQVHNKYVYFLLKINTNIQHPSILSTHGWRPVLAQPPGIARQPLSGYQCRVRGQKVRVISLARTINMRPSPLTACGHFRTVYWPLRSFSLTPVFRYCHIKGQHCAWCAGVVCCSGGWDGFHLTHPNNTQRQQTMYNLVVILHLYLNQRRPIVIWPPKQISITFYPNV